MFRIPENVLKARRTMPTWDGKILDPRYIPEAHQEAYLKLWGTWFRENPLYREPWMLDLIAWGKRRNKPTSRGPSSTESLPKLTPPTE